MPYRDHLKRLDDSEYQGHAIVHWTITIRDRRTGWLDARLYYRFRELLAHSFLRYAIASPMICLMPDHIHMVWMGILECSDQKLGMKHFRQHFNDALARIGFELQDQPHDHVLLQNEKTEAALMNLCEYIARNPERAKLVSIDGYKDYPFTGCLVPGYPELRPFEDDFWLRFDRVISYLRKNGLTKS
jgi:putative transposase